MAGELIDYARALCERTDQDQERRHDEIMDAFEELGLADRLAALRYLVDLLKEQFRDRPGSGA